MITVFATREGLEGEETSTGWLISDLVSFVALPSRNALNRFVRIVNPATGAATIAEVLDIGPHSDCDDAYVFTGARPLAESGISLVEGVKTTARNRAGIDLGQKVYHALGMTDNANVSWEFLSPALDLTPNGSPPR